jgi:hypothetical protein
LKVEFLSGFEKDLAHAKDKGLGQVILECIEIFEKADIVSCRSGKYSIPLFCIY